MDNARYIEILRMALAHPYYCPANPSSLGVTPYLCHVVRRMVGEGAVSFHEAQLTQNRVMSSLPFRHASVRDFIATKKCKALREVTEEEVRGWWANYINELESRSDNGLEYL